MKLQTDLERNKCQLVVLGLYVFFIGGKNLRKKILPVPYLVNIGTIWTTSPAAFFALAHSSNLWKIIGPAEPVPSKGGWTQKLERYMVYTPENLTWLARKSTIFNRDMMDIHLHSWWIFQPVMLVFGKVTFKKGMKVDFVYPPEN